jgi:hypothetical protein
VGVALLAVDPITETIPPEEDLPAAATLGRFRKALT